MDNCAANPASAFWADSASFVSLLVQPRILRTCWSLPPPLVFGGLFCGLPLGFRRYARLTGASAASPLAFVHQFQFGFAMAASIMSFCFAMRTPVPSRLFLEFVDACAFSAAGQTPGGQSNSSSSNLASIDSCRPVGLDILGRLALTACSDQIRSTCTRRFPRPLRVSSFAQVQFHAEAAPHIAGLRHVLPSFVRRTSRLLPPGAPDRAVASRAVSFLSFPRSRCGPPRCPPIRTFSRSPGMLSLFAPLSIASSGAAAATIRAASAIFGHPSSLLPTGRRPYASSSLALSGRLVSISLGLGLRRREFSSARRFRGGVFDGVSFDVLPYRVSPFPPKPHSLDSHRSAATFSAPASAAARLAASVAYLSNPNAPPPQLP